VFSFFLVFLFFWGGVLATALDDVCQIVPLVELLPFPNTSILSLQTPES